MTIRGRQLKKVMRWKSFLASLAPQRSISIKHLAQKLILEAQGGIEVYSTNLLYDKNPFCFELFLSAN